MVENQKKVNLEVYPDSKCKERQDWRKEGRFMVCHGGCYQQACRQPLSMFNKTKGVK